MCKTRDMAKEVSDWARENENVRAAVLTSTRANPHASVDALSDYDIELYVEDLQPFLEGDEWLETFGEVMVRDPYRPEIENEKHVWRLVMFKDAPRVDFHIILREVLEEAIEASDYDGWDMGYEVLLDKDGIVRGAEPWKPTYTQYWTKQPTEAEYERLVNVFWFDVTYVAKGLFRDELFYAKWMLDSLLHHEYLKTALAWYTGMENKWKSNPGAAGRWFKKQLAPQIWSDIEATFAGADFEENWKAMFKITEVFRYLMSEVGAHLGYTYPIEVDRGVTVYLNKVRNMAKSKGATPRSIPERIPEPLARFMKEKKENAQWVERLPEVIAACARRWDLHIETPLTEDYVEMSYSYCHSEKSSGCNVLDIFSILFSVVR